jgi:hypothetical protein
LPGGERNTWSVPASTVAGDPLRCPTIRHIGSRQPDARIIDVRRNPMASCFSCFKQLFAEGQEFSYDLNDLGRYYRHYLATIRHFHEVRRVRFIL